MLQIISFLSPAASSTLLVGKIDSHLSQEILILRLGLSRYFEIVVSCDGTLTLSATL